MPSSIHRPGATPRGHGRSAGRGADQGARGPELYGDVLLVLAHLAVLAAAAEVIERLAVAVDLPATAPGTPCAAAPRTAVHDQLEIARTGGWVDGSRVLALYMDDADRVKNSPLVGIVL